MYAVASATFFDCQLFFLFSVLVVDLIKMNRRKFKQFRSAAVHKMINLLLLLSSAGTMHTPFFVCFHFSSNVFWHFGFSAWFAATSAQYPLLIFAGCLEAKSFVAVVPMHIGDAIWTLLLDLEIPMNCAVFYNRQISSLSLSHSVAKHFETTTDKGTRSGNWNWEKKWTNSWTAKEELCEFVRFAILNMIRTQMT